MEITCNEAGKEFDLSSSISSRPLSFSQKHSVSQKTAIDDSNCSYEHQSNNCNVGATGILDSHLSSSSATPSSSCAAASSSASSAASSSSAAASSASSAAASSASSAAPSSSSSSLSFPVEQLMESNGLHSSRDVSVAAKQFLVYTNPHQNSKSLESTSSVVSSPSAPDACHRSSEAALRCCPVDNDANIAKSSDAYDEEEVVSANRVNVAGDSWEVAVSSQDFKFCCAHFVAFSGFRERLHGHNYTLAARLGGSVQHDGYVLDFGDIKVAIRTVCKSLSSYLLIPMKSDVLKITEEGQSLRIVCEDGSLFVLPVKDCMKLPIAHSTAEEIAAYLWELLIANISIVHLKKRKVMWLEVTVSERPGQEARYKKSI